MKTETETSFFSVVRRWPFLLYLVFFLLVFLQFPLSGSLTGSTDSWWYLAVFHELGNHIVGFFSGADAGSCLYPEHGLYRFGEPAFGSGLVYLFIRMFIRQELWSWWVFISLIFASNAWGIFLLSRHFLTDSRARLLSGIFFSASAFLFGLMDDPKVITWMPALLSLHFLFQYFILKRNNLLLYAGGVAGLSVWFSGYNFFFLFLILLGILIAGGGGRSLKENPRDYILRFIPALLIPVLPFLYLYFFSGGRSEGYNPIDLYRDARALCLQPADFFHALKGNGLYPSASYDNPSFVSSWHCLALGFLFWMLAIAGYVSQRKDQRLFLIWMLAGTLFALGPWIFIGDQQYPSLLHPIFRYVSFIRIPIRAFQVAMIPLSIFAGRGTQLLLSKLSRAGGLPFIILGIFLLENMPFSFQKFESNRYLEPSAECIDFFKGKEKAVAVFLPSAYKDDRYLFPLSKPAREQVYEYWQTKLKINLMNGTGYLTPPRLAMQDLIDHRADGNSWTAFLKKYQVEYVVFFPELILPGEEDLAAYADSVFRDFRKDEIGAIRIWRLKE